MPSKSPVIFPQEQRMLTQLGERIKLARLRRKLSTLVVSQRAGISRTTVYKVEAGEPGVTLGTYLRVLATLGLDGDFNAVASDDKVGRTLQDHGLLRTSVAKKRLKAPTPPTDAVSPTSIGPTTQDLMEHN